MSLYNIRSFWKIFYFCVLKHTYFQQGCDAFINLLLLEFQKFWFLSNLQTLQNFLTCLHTEFAVWLAILLVFLVIGFILFSIKLLQLRKFEQWLKVYNLFLQRLNLKYEIYICSWYMLYWQGWNIFKKLHVLIFLPIWVLLRRVFSCVILWCWL